MTNSAMPTTKIVSYLIEPVGMSPRDGGRDERRHRLVARPSGRRPSRATWPPATRMITVSPMAREAPRIERGDDARQRGGEDDAQRDLQLARAEAEGALAQRGGHGAQRVLGDRRDRRQHEQAEDDPGRQRVELVDLDPEDAAQDLGREEGEGEVAEDDRRHAGQQLEHRLDDLAHARRRVLGEVDRGQQAERDRDDEADRGQVQRARSAAGSRRRTAGRRRAAASTWCRTGSRRAARRRRTRSSPAAARGRSASS